MTAPPATRDAPAATPPAPDAPAAASRRTHVRPRTGWQAIDFAELWRARDLLWMFTVRDVKVRYKQTFFGYAWAVVVPAVQVLVLSVIFGRVLGVDEDVERALGVNPPYPLFLLAGQIVWNFFKAGVDGSSQSLQANAGIIRKIYVPRLVLPISAIGKPIADSAVVVVLLWAVILWYAGPGASESFDAVHFRPAALLSPLVLLLAVIPALGVGLVASAITVSYRDLQQVLPFAISTLYFATPVIFAVPADGAGRWLMYLNPVAGFIELHRALVLGVAVNWVGFLTSLGLSVLILVFGLYYFARAERKFADVA